jgi:DNA-binding NarL/FixJ family response regulator
LERAFTAQGQVAPSALISSCVKTASAPTMISASGDLTEREVEVLHLLAMGLSNMQIAKQLIISPRTVHAHVRSIYNKLGVTSRSAATRYAIQHQIA